MSSLKMNNPFKLFWQPQLQSPPLVICWDTDASRLGTKVSTHLIKNLGGEEFGKIEGADFFSWEGAAVYNSLIQIPQSKFYACLNNNLSIFYSSPPDYEIFEFLTTVLDVAEYYLRVKEIYTVGAMFSLAPHTFPRSLLPVFNSLEVKEQFRAYGLDFNLNYESPPGQRPTINSFLLWTAKRRDTPAVSLWVPIPFYLLSVSDHSAEKTILDFFNQRFELSMDLSLLNQNIRYQNEAIAQARFDFPDVDKTIRKLEAQIRPSEEETQELVTQLRKYLQ